MALYCILCSLECLAEVSMEHRVVREGLASLTFSLTFERLLG